jgi:hypothetical protein
MTLYRRTAEQEINLIIVIPKPLQILNYSQGSLAVRNRRIKIVLLAILVDGEPLKGEHAARTELRLDRTRQEDGRFPVNHA